MARATYSAKSKLHISDLHGYAIQSLFGLNGFEDNFRVHLATRDEIGTTNPLKWALPEQKDPKKAVLRPEAQLQLILSDTKSYYTFDKITLLNHYRMITGAERYHVYVLGYVGQLRHPEGGGKAATNPITLTNAKFQLPVAAHHSGQTIKIESAEKPLLGIEDLQDTQGATVVRMVSHRTTDNSWLSLLNTQNWKPVVEDRLKWKFTLSGKFKYDVDGTIDNLTVVHYRETYGIFNLVPNPDLAGYTDINNDLAEHCLDLPSDSLRPSSPAAFVKAQQTVKDQTQYAGMVLDSFIETVTVRFAPGRYHHYDLG